jgi:hypothetical protein
VSGGSALAPWGTALWWIWWGLHLVSLSPAEHIPPDSPGDISAPVALSSHQGFSAVPLLSFGQQLCHEDTLKHV